METKLLDIAEIYYNTRVGVSNIWEFWEKLERHQEETSYIKLHELS